MRRFTILNLMGLIVVLAVGIAALRQADDTWAGGLLLAMPLILCIGLVGGLCGKETHRARRLGFAIFGGAYFALAFLGLSESNLGRLPTSKLLLYVHQKVVGTVTMKVTWSTATTTSGTPLVVTSTFNPTGKPVATADDLMYFTTNIITGGAPGQVVATPFVPNPWKVFLPGAANGEAFQAVGHNLFALIFGVVGAFIARRFEERPADQWKSAFPLEASDSHEKPIVV